MGGGSSVVRFQIILTYIGIIATFVQVGRWAVGLVGWLRGYKIVYVVHEHFLIAAFVRFYFRSYLWVVCKLW